MALDDLPEVHEAAQLVRGGRDRHGHDRVARLCGREQVAHRADAADSSGDARHLAERAALAELLEAPEFHDVELRVRHLAVVAKVYADLGVALDARDRVYYDSLCHASPRFSR